MVVYHAYFFNFLTSLPNRTLFNDRLNLYVGADNLLDKDYEESFALPQAGRTIYGGAEIRF